MKFTELSVEDQKRAIEKNRDINIDYDYDSDLRAEFINKMKEYGFDDINLLVDVSCSQGSGASFDTKYVDIEKYLRKVKKWSKYKSLHELIRIKDLDCTIERRSSHYVHSNTVYASIETWMLELTDKQESLAQELESDITDFVRSESDSIHSDIENLMLFLISDDQVKEAIISNDMDFELADPDVMYL